MSGVDLSRFQATFFAESREGLDAMETGLLALEAGNADSETVNTIFRAAHSIKGGSATFGFRAIADTTHRLETLLDQVRSGRRAADATVSDALLISVDVLRGMLDRAENDNPDDEGDAELDAKLAALLGAQAKTVAVVTASQRFSRWKIKFTPKPNLFLTGNDPLRIARDLAELGELTSRCDVAALPSMRDMDCTRAYLAWEFELQADLEKKQIESVFSWIEDECDLHIEGLVACAPENLADSAATNVTPIAAARDKKERAEGDGSIRVAVGKVDALINLVGELVITQAMLQQQSTQLDPRINERLMNGLAQLERNTRDLQETVMSVRMLPVAFVFSRFPRLVRDLADRLGKEVQLRRTGEATELDKGMIERIIDPLTHLVRNAIDHGLELPDQRADAGKNSTGTITLSASHQGGHIVIDVADDGRGLDRLRILAKAAERGLDVDEAMSDGDVWQLIFHPGLSTAENVTDVSGRGVGMDVVKRNITALGGDVDIQSHAGRGMRVRIRLPLTLAIVDGMSVSVGDEIFILPLSYVVESLQPADDSIKSIGGTRRVLRVHGEYLPLLPLAQLFGVRSSGKDIAHKGVVVVVESEGRKLALEIDELIGQQQVVVKSIESNYRQVDGISGATILGDGRVALIVDIGSLVRGAANAA